MILVFGNMPCTNFFKQLEYPLTEILGTKKVFQSLDFFFKLVGIFSYT